MFENYFEKLTWHEIILKLIIPFLATLFFIQGFRTYVINLYITVFNIVYVGSGPLEPVLTVLVFLTPIFALLANRRISTRRLIIGSTILISLFALPISLGLPYQLEILLSSLVIAFFLIFFTFHLSYQTQNRPKYGTTGQAALFTSSIALAILYDILVRTYGVTYDISRLPTYFPVQIILSFILILLTFLIYQSHPSLASESFKSDQEEFTSVPIWKGILLFSGVGAFLFLELNFFANPHTILRYIFPIYNILDLIILICLTVLIMTISILALGFLKLGQLFKINNTRLVAVGINVLLFGIILVFGQGWISYLFILASHFFIIVSLYTLLQYVLHPKSHWSPTVLALSVMVGFFFLLLWDVLLAFTFAHAFLGSLGAIFRGQAPYVVLSFSVIFYIASMYATLKLRRLKQ